MVGRSHAVYKASLPPSFVAHPEACVSLRAIPDSRIRPLVGYEGERVVSEAQAATEWAVAWSEIAGACERALMSLHPRHPRRDELLALTRDARLAARLPAELPLQSA